jgi:hypothetical protein
MRTFLMLLTLLMALSVPTVRADELAPELRPFQPDGCTDFVEGTLKHPQQWAHCCYEHDLRFWAGGSEAGRDRADLALRECVRATGAKLIAELMYRAVRLGKQIPAKNPDQRWGNGWAEDRPAYQPLSVGEIAAVVQASGQYEIPSEMKGRLFIELARELATEPAEKLAATPAVEAR